MLWLIFFNVVAILFVFMFYFDGIGLVTDAISEHRKPANFHADTSENEIYEEVF